MTAETVWPWVLFGFEIVGVVGNWVIGQRQLWWGWAIVLVHSIPWVVYSVIYGKPGFIAMAGLWWTVNALNLRKWWRDQRHAEQFDIT